MNLIHIVPTENGIPPINEPALCRAPIERGVPWLFALSVPAWEAGDPVEAVLCPECLAILRLPVEGREP